MAWVLPGVTCWLASLLKCWARPQLDCESGEFLKSGSGLGALAEFRLTTEYTPGFRWAADAPGPSPAFGITVECLPQTPAEKTLGSRVQNPTTPTARASRGPQARSSPNAGCGAERALGGEARWQRPFPAHLSSLLAPPGILCSSFSLSLLLWAG